MRRRSAFVMGLALLIATSVWASDYWIKVKDCNGCTVELGPASPTSTPTYAPTATATATSTPTATPTATPTPSQVTIQLTAPQSSLIQCQQQTAGNSNRLTLSPGNTATVGCMTTGNSVDLAANATVMADCGGATSNQSWTQLQAGQVAKITCAGGYSTPTPYPTATATPPALPAGWPAPPAIPPAPALVSPLQIAPGATVAGAKINGDGRTDDTAGIQTALNSADVIIKPGVYAISGNVTIPTGRNIQCQQATLFDTQAKNTVMLKIGFSSNSVGNNSITGCTLAGTDTAADHSTYQGGVSGYSELLEISTGWGIHTDHVLLSGLTVRDAQGDGIITYSGCGTKNTGSPCNGGAPGTEGPSNVFIVNTTVVHTAQPGIHLNGGQNLVVTGTNAKDTVIAEEGDANVLQLMSAWWYNNFIGNQYGWYNPQEVGKFYGSYTTCTNHTELNMNDSNCWFWNNQVDGTASNGRPGQIWQQYGCAGATAAKGGNYANNKATNGAIIRTGC